MPQTPPKRRQNVSQRKRDAADERDRARGVRLRPRGRQRCPHSHERDGERADEVDARGAGSGQGAAGGLVEFLVDAEGEVETAAREGQSEAGYEDGDGASEKADVVR